ncbi:hypothetical protein [Streptomyces sp. NPDC029674]|uniref:hypothetical protein n=1 Tax=Streptomyces sp. NPDC029674 TaxID=3365297 RepID=UPI00384DDB44
MDATAGEGTGSRTWPSSLTTAPGDIIEPTGTAEPTIPAQPAAGPTRESEEDPADAGQSDQAALSTTLHGLPSKVVAGSGWKNFTFRATNTSAKVIKSADVHTRLAALDHSGREMWRLLTLQWYDEAAGAWKTVDPEIGYLTTLAEMAPGEHADIELRMKADASTPVGLAWAFGSYVDEDDVYGHSEPTGYDFEIVVEGSSPSAEGNKPAPQDDLKELPVTGKPAAATGTGKPTATGIRDDVTRPVTGRPGSADDSTGRADSGTALAETGSDAASGWMLGAGGASIALGTVLTAAAQRRRRHIS